MSATSSVGADRTPLVDTMMEKVALFCWCKFVYLGIKTHRKMNLWHGEGLGKYPQECGLIHLKLRGQVDSDIREGGTFPALLEFQLAHRVYQDMEHFRSGNNAPRPMGAPS